MGKLSIYSSGKSEIVPVSMTAFTLFTAVFGLVLMITPKGLHSSAHIPDPGTSTVISIDIPDGATVYEGDRIDCTITGVQDMYWRLHDSHTMGAVHTTFIQDDPVLVNVEQFSDDEVILTVYGDTGTEILSDRTEIVLHKMYWGDPHLHANVGDYHAHSYLYSMLQKAVEYKEQGEWWALDWLVSQSHAFRSFMCKTTPHGGFSGRRDDLNAYNDPGELTVFMGAEYSAASKFKHTMHLTAVYSGDCTDLANKDYLCSSMAIGHPNPASSATKLINRCWWIVNNTSSDIILFPHHTTANWYHDKWEDFETFWTHWDEDGRDRFIRGIELISKHGSNMDHYTGGLPSIKEGSCGYGDAKKFIEYAVHLWSNKSGGAGTGRILGFHAATDWHQLELDETSIGKKEGPIGKMGVWARYNDRSRLFEGMKFGRTMAGDYQNININFRIDGEHAFGNWINISGPADIEVVAWPRTGSGAQITDLYLVHYDASDGSWESDVIDHVVYPIQPDGPAFIHYTNSVSVGERDAFWVTTRAYNPADENLMFNGDGHPPVPLNPYRSWSSPVWIDRIDDME